MLVLEHLALKLCYACRKRVGTSIHCVLQDMVKRGFDFVAHLDWALASVTHQSLLLLGRQVLTCAELRNLLMNTDQKRKCSRVRNLGTCL